VARIGVALVIEDEPVVIGPWWRSLGRQLLYEVDCEDDAGLALETAVQPDAGEGLVNGPVRVVG
jgi:hypothetical protein